MRHLKNFLIATVLTFNFIGSVNALTTLDGQTFPDIPDTSKGVVIYTYNNDYYILHSQGSCSSYSYITITNNDHLTMGSCYMTQYKLVNNSWVSQGSKQNQPFSSIVATTTNLGGALNGQTITGGYNLIKQQEDFNNYTQEGYSSHGIYFNQNNISNIWNSFFEGKSPSYFYTYNNNYTGGNSVYKNWTNELHASDYPNISCRYMDNSYFDCYFLPNIDVLSVSGSSSSVYLSPNYTDPYPIFHFKMQVNSPNISNISFAGSFNYYTNYSSTYTSNFNIVNPSNGTTYNTKKFDYAPFVLPDYLNGYKKVDLTPNDKYIMISHVQSGSVFIPKSSFDAYGGLLSYYDNELSSQTYDSYIQDYTVMEDEQFVRQDFDLSNYYGADWVMFSKYLYLEGEDNVSYSIWVPDDSYDSQVTITPNNHGGNDFDYEYMDENGVVQNGNVSSVDLSQYSLEFNSKEGSIYKAKSLLVSLKDMNYIWNSSFDIFYNNLPNLVQLFLIFFFNIIMILICLMLVGWKE